jgi:hypothetical protein
MQTNWVDALMDLRSQPLLPAEDDTGPDWRRMVASCLQLELYQNKWERASLESMLKQSELKRDQRRRLDVIFGRGCSR